MVNHSLSHGAVSLVSLVSAQMLADKVKNNFPVFYGWVATLSDWLINSFEISMRQSHMESAMIALIFGLMWGLAFWHISAKTVYR